MKKFFMITTFIILAACGKNNTVDSKSQSGANDLQTGSTTEYSQFEGSYDLIEMNTPDCSSTIQIVKECDGLKIVNHNLGPEEFCRINLGEKKDEFGTTTTTLSKNVLTTVYLLNDNKSPIKKAYTNTLTLNDNGYLRKESSLKSRKSNCLYLKR